MTDFATVLNRLWPEGDERVHGLRAGIAAAATSVFRRYGLTSNFLIAHAMAQFSHECGAGLEMEESLYYSAERLVEVWPKHFNRGNAPFYAHSPRRLANYIYEPPLHNDLGNRPNTDDGWNFRGRGLSQCTGREGYTKLAEKTGLDLLARPELLCDPRTALECGVADFILCGCLPYAKNNDVIGVTRALNGGLIGLKEREEWLRKWRAALIGVKILDRPPQVVPLPPPAPKPKAKHIVAGGLIAAGAAAASRAHSLPNAVLLVAAGLAAAIVAYLIFHKLQKKG